jgi:hypothetical protein
MLSGNLLTAVPEMFVNPSTADLRPKGAGSDIGADEFTPNARPVILNLPLSGTNSLVSFTTLLGRSYDVQRANEVMGSAWSLVAANIAGSGGVIQATDTNATSQARRFYLVRLLSSITSCDERPSRVGSFRPLWDHFARRHQRVEPASFSSSSDTRRGPHRSTAGQKARPEPN